MTKHSHGGRVLGAMAILALLTSGTLTAQNAPNTLGQPLLDAAGDVRDDAFIRIPLRADDQKYADIDGNRLKSFLMEVDAISLADRDRGNVFWGRNIGTVGHEETQDWVERYFRANGLEDVHRQSFDVGPQWKPESWTIGFSAGGRSFELESARPPQGAESTPPGGLDFELVWVGTGSDADYIGRDVRGKAVLILDIPRPGRLEFERSATRAEADRPALRLPLRPDVEGLPMHVFETARAEVSLDPVLRLLVSEGADVPTPEDVAAIAVGERNRVDLHEKALQPVSIDIRILQVVRS